ncbi:unnamed protein product [Rotaria sordida]|uniref:N-acetyltransferase domain-containing protein n=1 Tax=Rotaria sordida TaxID=392033 RepID=A0A819VUM8_9BILA|nr:unnamed protein product [Rotaria sordida]CAF4114723.1 unnamed protein product [Rotaria sordida]
MATTFVEDTPWKINIVHENDLVDLLPLLQGYCEFYYQTEEISRTSDELLLSVSRALIASPKQEGIPLLVRHVQDGKSVGNRLAITEDLYVDQSYRGQGIADLLIGKCARYAREHGALCLTWQTSVKNHHAQAVCDRCGAMKSDRWLNYTLPL